MRVASCAVLALAFLSACASPQQVDTLSDPKRSPGSASEPASPDYEKYFRENRNNKQTALGRLCYSLEQISSAWGGIYVSIFDEFPEKDAKILVKRAKKNYDGAEKDLGSAEGLSSGLLSFRDHVVGMIRKGQQFLTGIPDSATRAQRDQLWADLKSVMATLEKAPALNEFNREAKNDPSSCPTYSETPPPRPTPEPPTPKPSS